MRKLICIPFLLIVLAGNAQKFEEVFTLRDTLANGVIPFYPNYTSEFINGNDTINISPILLFYPGESDFKGVHLHGFWITGIGLNRNMEIKIMDNSFKFVECKFSEGPSSNVRIYALNTTNTDDLIKSIEYLKVADKIYLPTEWSKKYFNRLIGGFEKVTCTWYETY